LMAKLLHPLQSSQWLFLTGVAVLTMLFGWYWRVCRQRWCWSPCCFRSP